MQRSARKILLVDDHDDTARALARLLDLSGYNVRTAGSVAGAIQLCQHNEFDLLISDIGLPDGTGFELMREMISKKAGVKGIAVSGYAMDDDIQTGREAGFAAHLVKPVAFATLQETIRRVMPE